ncbi:MAG: methionine adenosyltransferase [Gemmatimonas sp.]|nr:methionine adenosyltransferase [Gemmatimonas sp.]
MSAVESSLRAPARTTYTFTSESVSEGHPDKVCDYIADSILDAHLVQDPDSRVACEVLCKEDRVVLAGEITSGATVDLDAVVRQAIEEIGYVDPDQPFRPDAVKILSFLSQQSSEIDQGVSAGTSLSGEQGAGDQGIMFGYATAETPELMPLPILLAHRLAATLATHRKIGTVDWLRPDAKTQVSVTYCGNEPLQVTDVLISTQHAASVDRETIRNFLATTVIPEALAGWFHDDLRILVNPTGSFVLGGPSADAGVTGRKIIVDTYGGMGRHGGGAFSGKDSSKVDRSGAYFCRKVAREVVRNGFGKKAELQVAYAIGMAQPISIKVDTFGTGDDRAAADFIRDNFDFRPRSIVETLDLLRPIFRTTTNYGHFGKPALPWEL